MEIKPWRKWGLGLAAFCATLVLWPRMIVAGGEVQDVNQLKAELEAQKQRQTELEDKINQLEARQELEEQSVQEKIEQAGGQEKKEGAIPEVLQWAGKLNWYGDFRYRY